jgi:DNA polymerase
MAWTERQRMMLEEIGIRLWMPPPVPLPAGARPEADRVAAPVREAIAPRARQHDASPSAGRATMPSAPAAEPLALDPARAIGVDALDADALAARAAACTACALCTGRSHSVFASGNLQADWMVVGDAPDADDDAAGAPFAGRAGQLLDNMLAALRLSRGPATRARHVYVAPAVKCRPPAGRAPEPSEVERCRPYLARQVGLVQPRLIVAMGRVAAQALVGSAEPAARLRGRVHSFEGVPVVVTYSPAHLLRHPQDKAAAWDDLCLALEVVGAAEPARAAAT